MNSEPAIRAFHNAILKAASEKLGRDLTEQERRFVTSRQSFIALEMIRDTVTHEPAEYVEAYLNSEREPQETRP